MKFWYLPLDKVTDKSQELASLPAVSIAAFKDGATNLFQKHKIMAGDVLALHDGNSFVALARVTRSSDQDFAWERLPHTDFPQRTRAPSIEEVPHGERDGFKVGIDALLQSFEIADDVVEEPKSEKESREPRNIILYGPPGTGKTYSVKQRALELINGPNGTATEEEWRRLLKNHQIAFCTFHQNMSYEDFIEGLRATTDDEGINYRIENGVFKEICERARREYRRIAPKNTLGDLDLFNEAWESLIEELEETKDWASVKTGTLTYPFRSTKSRGIQFLQPNSEKEKWRPVTKKQVLAYWESRNQWGPDPEKLSVERATKLVAERTKSAGRHNATQTLIVYEKIRQLAQEIQKADKSGEPEQFVLVIDEINRANMSKVFGELITLLEPDKRLSMSDEITLTLPGSKEPFGVPPNLHIIGTMNTADRSIALMDVALRRRFDFEEMMPDRVVIETELKKAAVDDDLLQAVLNVFTAINERLVFLYDREHQIGHAYFLKIRKWKDLQKVFATKIIPLLQEYFYGQWLKVGLCLGYPMTPDENPTERRFGVQGEDQPTILICRKMDEKKTIRVDHSEYEDTWVWDVHPYFKPGSKEFNGAKEDWLKKAFEEVFDSPPKETQS